MYILCVWADDDITIEQEKADGGGGVLYIGRSPAGAISTVLKISAFKMRRRIFKFNIFLYFFVVVE